MRKAQKTNKFISIIVPAYKQEKTIRKNIYAIKKVMDTLPLKYEIIIAVDGFIDKTFETAKKVKSPVVKVVGYKHNHGKGHAVRFGMAKAKGNIIGFIDAGMDISPKGLPRLIKIFEQNDADIILASKLHSKSKVNYPSSRRILTKGYAFIVRLLFGLPIHDTQVGMKIYKREALEKVLPRLLVKEYAFDIEILSVAYRLGYRNIHEGPVDLFFTPASTITSGNYLLSKNFWRVVLCMLWDTTAVFYRLKILHYYDDKNRKNWLTPQYLTLNSK